MCINTPQTHSLSHKVLSAYHLKWIAMFAMTADHIGWALYDYDSLISEWLHFFGRLVAPLMAYFLVVGFLRTQDVRAYACRLGIFAIISEPAYALYNASIINNFTAQTLLSIVKHGNVLFSLSLSLFALIVLNTRMHIGLKVILLSAIAIMIQQMDYGLGMLFWVLLFYHFYNSRWLVIIYIVTLPIAYVLIYGFHQTVGLGFMHYGMILTGLLIYLYNGDKGATWGGRYLFYIFYPVHLLILSIIMYFYWL